jgi:hypothetical protein
LRAKVESGSVNVDVLGPLKEFHSSKMLHEVLNNSSVHSASSPRDLRLVTTTIILVFTD